ncbi:MgtC/SapB family protein [Liquorilactobacillus capillatus]|uniref:MgtC SapB transporter n=1 Tax=Liquorilactobacillus capillatus DSM 19910 TaxID=1423731 RepID=A0A0R1M9X5_9LACO|nr:MgtC/SapB family protein [Liquorilactobacillus capillatus]KRL02612.1 MgtC SapB transporter [Liquorilactobacillus capillatus DSM 19910]
METQLDYLIRLVEAVIYGGLVGYERQLRLKSAGIRTHILITLGAALMMLISKYGFFDMLNHAQVDLDPSRVASQVVSSIGFIGVGAILTYRHGIEGLTTSASIWCVTAIGLAVGAGMHFLAFTATILILLIQILLHHRHFLDGLPGALEGRLIVHLKGDTRMMEKIVEELRSQKIKKLQAIVLAYDSENLIFKLNFIIQTEEELSFIVIFLSQYKQITEVENVKSL